MKLQILCGLLLLCFAGAIVPDICKTDRIERIFSGTADHVRDNFLQNFATNVRVLAYGNTYFTNKLQLTNYLPNMFDHLLEMVTLVEGRPIVDEGHNVCSLTLITAMRLRKEETNSSCLVQARASVRIYWNNQGKVVRWDEIPEVPTKQRECVRAAFSHLSPLRPRISREDVSSSPSSTQRRRKSRQSNVDGWQS